MTNQGSCGFSGSCGACVFCGFCGSCGGSELLISEVHSDSSSTVLYPPFHTVHLLQHHYSIDIMNNSVQVQWNQEKNKFMSLYSFCDKVPNVYSYLWAGKTKQKQCILYDYRINQYTKYCAILEGLEGQMKRSFTP